MFNPADWLVVNKFVRNCKMVNPVTFASILDLRPGKHLT